MAIDSKININTAPVAEFLQLEKVNGVFAQLIVEYREKMDLLQYLQIFQRLLESMLKLMK